MKLLKILLASSLLSVCLVVDAITNPSTEEDKFLSLAKEYEFKYFARFPEEGLLRGRSNVDLDRFSDTSYSAIRIWEKKEDHFLLRLKGINESSMTNPVVKLSYQLLTEHLQNKQNSRICQETLWDVKPLNGWHTHTTMLAAAQPVGTPKLRQQALARWATFPTLVNHEIDNLKLGLQKGYTSPKPAVQRVLNQIQQILTSPIESSPYYSMAKRDTDITFKTEIHQLISTVINPSLKKYVDFIESEYLPHARTNVGVWDLPNGDLCYKSLIKYNTTLTISPEDIHKIGLAQMQRISEAVAEIGLRR